MGFHEEHRNVVAERWASKFHTSGMTADKFGKYMKKTMLEYGWSESDADKMVAKAVGKGMEQ